MINLPKNNVNFAAGIVGRNGGVHACWQLRGPIPVEDVPQDVQQVFDRKDVRVTGVAVFYETETGEKVSLYQR